MFYLRGNQIRCGDCDATDTVNRRDPNAITRWKVAHQRVCGAVKR